MHLIGVGLNKWHFKSMENSPVSNTVLKLDGSSVVFALLDSNDTDGEIAHAEGQVDPGRLIALREELEGITEHYLARIAVVHHHVLPVAFAGGPDGRTEPMMVLRNAGTVLHTLARHRFDLILHGHWHRQQVARLDMGQDDDDSFPMIVAGAGSAARKVGDQNANSFNLITIADNGRIVLKSVFYGNGHAPDPNGRAGEQVRIYREPFAFVKRRAYARARERHWIECDHREQVFDISENGDLWVRHEVRGLRLAWGNEPYRSRRLIARVVRSGEVLPTNRWILEGGIEIKEEQTQNVSSRKERICRISLPGGGLTSAGEECRRYSLRFPCVNCVTMTRWESNERENHARAHGEGDYDDANDVSLGVLILHPYGRLVISLKFPESFSEIQPSVRCLRHPAYPRYEIDDDGDVVFPAREQLIEDSGLKSEEEPRLSYQVPRTWRLEVERPMVGYLYQLRWTVPGSTPDRVVEGETRADREALLRLADRRHSNPAANEPDQAASDAFDALKESMVSRLASRRAQERLIVALFVYDTNRLALIPVLVHRSWSRNQWPEFMVPLGAGIAGAAFLQRRAVVWSRGYAHESLIQPVPHPHGKDEDPVLLEEVVAQPIYHERFQDEQRPPPWATIGVVVVGSDSPASRVRKLMFDDTEAKELAADIRINAQLAAAKVVDALR
jgi:hypothetical protein